MWHVCGKGEMYIMFWWRDVRARDHLEDLGVDWRMIIKVDLQEAGWGGTDCSDLAQDRGTWRGLVSAVMILWVP
jgi:hypothetical protein